MFVVEVGVIYYNGVYVNYVYDYLYLYVENVGLMFELFCLCCSGCCKVLYFVLMLFVVSVMGLMGCLIEVVLLEVGFVFVNNGYNLMKWVFEYFVVEVVVCGIDMMILWFGNIMGYLCMGLC